MEMMNIWNHNETHAWNKSYSIGLNVHFRLLNWKMYTCVNNRKSAVPTKYNILPMEITNTCYMQVSRFFRYRKTSNFLEF